MNQEPKHRRYIPVATAWVFGWLVYMIAMVLTVYDGVLSIIFQPLIGAFVTSFTVGICFVAGLIFRLPAVGKIWRAAWFTAPLLLVGSIALMLYGTELGLTQTFTDPETESQHTGLRSDVAISCYFAMIFAVCNWPLRNKDA